MSYLCQDVVDLFADLGVVLPQYPEQSQNLHLQEGISDARHVVFWRVSRARQLLQMLHQHGREWGVVGYQLGVVQAEVRHESDTAEQHTVVLAVLQQRFRLAEEVLLEIGYFADDSHGAEGGLALDVGVRR